MLDVYRSLTGPVFLAVAANAILGNQTIIRGKQVTGIRIDQVHSSPADGHYFLAAGASGHAAAGALRHHHDRPASVPGGLSLQLLGPARQRQYSKTRNREWAFAH